MKSLQFYKKVGEEGIRQDNKRDKYNQSTLNVCVKMS
jgi:hypothetical protein